MSLERASSVPPFAVEHGVRNPVFPVIRTPQEIELGNDIGTPPPLPAPPPEGGDVEGATP